MGQEDISVEVPEGVLQSDKGWFPIVNELQVGYDFVEIFVPVAAVVQTEGPSSIIPLVFLVEHTRYEDNGDNVVRAGFAPFGKESGKKRVDNLLVVAFAVSGKFPELSTDLDEDRDFG